MSRKIIQIDEDLCIGCGLCANTCKQSAIEIIDGKAKVTRDDFCDGIGRCMPVCPTGAITFSNRDIKNKSAGCPSMNTKIMNKSQALKTNPNVPSMLNQWPVQIKLVVETAPFFENANLLIAADCTAFAYGNFHNDFMKDKVTLIGCPKLDDIDYSEKLAEIIKNNSINSITVTKMEVPCCYGLEAAVKQAVQISGKNIPLEVITISTDGNKI